MKCRSSLKWVCEVGELGWVGLRETATDFRLSGTNKIELNCTDRVHTALPEPTQHGLSGGWMDGWGDWNKCTSAVKLPLSEVMKSRAGFCGVVVGGLAIHRIAEWRALGTTATDDGACGAGGLSVLNESESVQFDFAHVHRIYYCTFCTTCASGLASLTPSRETTTSTSSRVIVSHAC